MLFGIETTTELASERQLAYIASLGYTPPKHLGKGDAAHLISRLVRPATRALSETFSNATESVLGKEVHRLAESAIVRADYASALPCYGPTLTWEQMAAAGGDRELTLEERYAVIYTLASALPLESFLLLKARGARKCPELVAYKKQVDEALRAQAGA